jgi:hypothetical protein
MKRSPLIALVALLCCSVVSAANEYEGKRELLIELGYLDLDMGNVATHDYGSAKGPRAAVSIGWNRTSAIQLGLRVGIAALESDGDESVKGLSAGAFLGLKVPTKGKFTPLAVIGVSLPQGNLGARYEYSLDLRAGLEIHLSPRYGLGVNLEYQKFDGEDLVPNGNALHADVGFLFKF